MGIMVDSLLWVAVQDLYHQPAFFEMSEYTTFRLLASRVFCRCRASETLKRIRSLGLLGFRAFRLGFRV